jgi:hypothetical protein
LEDSYQGVVTISDSMIIIKHVKNIPGLIISMHLIIESNCAVGPWVCASEERSRTWRREVPCSIMVMVDRGSLSQPVQIWCRISGISIQRDMVSGERIKNDDDDIWGILTGNITFSIY